MTLIEVTIVMALSALVVLGLIGFYASSQAIWTRDSSRAIAQRDATLLIEKLSEEAHRAAHVTVADSPDSLHQSLQFYDVGMTQGARFWWSESDARVHYGPTPSQDDGPVVGSMVARFQVDTFTCGVQVRLLSVRATENDVVNLTGAAALLNRGQP
jgi:hypothetical protein